MPKLDTYGSQPPIELLRQYQDFGGLYDRDKMFWKVLLINFIFAFIFILPLFIITLHYDYINFSTFKT